MLCASEGNLNSLEWKDYIVKHFWFSESSPFKDGRNKEEVQGNSY
jgi:hypothetical protein